MTAAPPIQSFFSTTQHLQPGLGEIAGGDQAVVARTDDDGVVGGHAALLGFQLFERQVDGRFNRLQRVGEAARVMPWASHMNQGSRESGSQMMPRSCR